jgi:predicted bacteriocin transport accessory protein
LLILGVYGIIIKVRGEEMFKRKKEKSRKLGLGIGLVVFIGIIILSAILSNLATTEKQAIKEINFNEYLSLIKDTNSKNYIYVGKTGCSYCEKIEPILKDLGKELNITFNYLDIHSLSTDEYNEFLKSDDVFAGDWGTPTLLITENGQVIDSHVGYADNATIKSFLQGENNQTSDLIKEVNIDQYLELMNASGKNYIYVGRTGCSYCQKIEPILNQVVEELDITLYYLNIENFDEEQFNKLRNSNELFKDNKWGTPALLIMQDGELVNSKIGYSEYIIIKNFFLEK